MNSSDDSRSLPVPEWISVTSPEVTLLIKSLLRLGQELEGAEMFQYTLLGGSQISAIGNRLTSEGCLSSNTVETAFGSARKIIKKTKLRPDEERALIFDIRRGADVSVMIREASSRALVRLLNGARESLSYKDILVTFICYRSIIEQVGHLSVFVRDVRELRKSGQLHPSWDADVSYLLALKELAHKSFYGTRVDWMRLADGANPLSADVIADTCRQGYEPSPDLTDVTSKSCLKGIDILGKRIDGVRSAYDLLCDFAHPNYGAVLASQLSSNVRRGVYDLNFVDGCLHKGPPVQFLKTYKGVTVFIFSTVVKVVEAAVTLLNECGDEAAAADTAARRVMPALIARTKDLWNPYLLCPCRSGKKLRFCCGVARQ